MKFSASAQRALDQYLKTLRISMAGAPATEREEVEEEVRVHIERELGAQSGPVEWMRLQGVLDRLGSPLQWVRAEELSAWQRFLLHLRHGPAGLRLALLSLGLFAMSGLAWAQAGPMGGALCLLVAFCVARAGAPTHADDDEGRARAWLVAPALLVVYAAGAAVLLVGWLVPEVILAEQVLRLEALKPRFPALAVHVAERVMAVLERPQDLTRTAVALAKVSAWTVAPLGLWWMLLGVWAWRRPAGMQALLRPLLTRPRARTLGLALTLAGLALILGSAGLTIAKHVHFAQVSGTLLG